MKQNVAEALKEILMCKELDIKPNFSSLSEKYGVDRHTLRKYYINGCATARKRNRPSKYDPYKELILELLENSNSTLKGIHNYMAHEVEGFPANYWSFHSYVISLGYVPRNKRKPHPRFETAIGQQLQFDWKEDITLHTVTGETITKQIFSATLGYSRYHIFVVSDGKGTNDVIICLIETLRRLGGLPRECLTDNMAAVVSCRGSDRKKLPVIVQLERDLGIDIRLCKPRSPMTKGKVESSNRFVNRIMAYDGRIKDEADFVKAIHDIETDSNLEINEWTKIPPIRLFSDERKTLVPLPRKMMLESYIREMYTTKVDSTMLVRFRGSYYSVPAKYIGKTVKAFAVGDGRIVIQHNGTTIATHSVGPAKVNYSGNDYREALRGSGIADDALIRKTAESNLEQLGRI